MTGYFLSAALGIWGAGLDTASLRPWATLLVAQATAPADPRMRRRPRMTHRLAASDRGTRAAGRRGRGPGRGLGEAGRGRPGPGDRAEGRPEGRDQRSPGPRPGPAHADAMATENAATASAATANAATASRRASKATALASRGSAAARTPWLRTRLRTWLRHRLRTWARSGRPWPGDSDGQRGPRPGGPERRVGGPGHRQGPPAHFARHRSGDSLFDQLDRDGDHSISRGRSSIAA